MKRRGKGQGKGSIGVLALIVVIASTLVAVPPAAARRRFKGILRGLVIATGVRKIARPLNKFINTITARKGLVARQATRVVPVVSVGGKTHVGAAQVSGPAWRVKKVRACLQIQGELSGGKHKVALYIPSSSDNPLRIRRVPDVGVTALIDSTVWGKKVGPKGGRTHTDLIRAGAIAWVVTKVARSLDKGIRTLTRIDFPTKVVPNLSVGKKGYIGLAQVVGSHGALAKVNAVFTYEDTFRKRYRVRIALPVDHRGGIKFRRIDGTAVSAFVLTTIRKHARKPPPPPPPPPPVRTPTYQGGTTHRRRPLPPPPIDHGYGDEDDEDYEDDGDYDGGSARLWHRYFYRSGRSGASRCRKHRRRSCRKCVKKYRKAEEKYEKKRRKHRKKRHKRRKKHRKHGRWGDDEDDEDDEDDHPGRGHGRGRGRGW